MYPYLLFRSVRINLHQDTVNVRKCEKMLVNISIPYWGSNSAPIVITFCFHPNFTSFIILSFFPHHHALTLIYIHQLGSPLNPNGMTTFLISSILSAGGRSQSSGCVLSTMVTMSNGSPLLERTCWIVMLSLHRFSSLSYEK